MTGRSCCRLGGLVGVVLALIPTTGCVLASDLVNPNLLAGFGLDPTTIRGAQGTVLVTFNNTTDFTADFFVLASDSSSDAASNAYLVPGSDVLAGEIRTLVVDCPIGALTPASFDAAGAVSAVAVRVTVADQVVDVTYDGSPLQSGDEFICGDLIEVRLIDVGTDEDVAFQLLIRVIPS